MRIGWTFVVTLALAGPAAWLPAQAQTKLPLKLHTLGLPLPDGSPTQMRPAISPEILGGSLGGSTASVHWDPTRSQSLGTGSRALLDPVVSKENIGFYNASSQTLSFQIEVGGAMRTLMLGAREVVTLPLGGQATARGIIGTGAVDTATALTGGALYTIKSEADKWVFARF